MNKGSHLLGCTCVSAVFILLVCGASAYGTKSASKPETRADVIRIDGMAAFGPLEKPPAVFLHDAHTRALAEKNKDCTACHPIEKDRVFPKFKRTEETDRITVMNLYHQGCISCHGERKVAGEKAGPVECDGCHSDTPKHLYAAEPMGFDKSLHFRHSRASGGKCEKCHHRYDEKQEKLFYAKGQEETCRYCHKAETRGDTVSMRLASHIACINCHRVNLANNNPTGPLECSGCHDPAAQGKIKKVDAVPRMKRNQPDVSLMKGAQAPGEAGTSDKNRMHFVPFDHKAHEAFNDTCRVCHHESLEPCTACHTLSGSREGKWVTLDQAMHRSGADQSCLGCHESQLKEKTCAGCHQFMGKAVRKTEDYCLRCHMPAVGKEPMINKPEREKSVAAAALASRSFSTGNFTQADVPETVRIERLSNEYQAVDFPHRRIVNTLVERIKESKLAGYFHGREGTVCQGCHHHSPVSKKPPQCGHCHGKTYDGKKPLKPGIMGAYHLQCMGCHQKMGIEKAGCTDCHKTNSNT